MSQPQDNKPNAEDVDAVESKEVDTKETMASNGSSVENGTSDVSDSPPVEEELTDHALEIEHLKKELDTMQDRLLRQAAEYQNYRRRTEQEKSSLIDLGKILVIQELLDVIDDFDRSIEAAEAIDESQPSLDAYRNLKEGVLLVYRKFVDTLSRIGVEPIEAVGKPFNVDEHEAMMQQPAPEGTEPGIVLNEFQKGYRFGDRVLRHSKVVVSS